MIRDAAFSGDRQYRYWLKRIWSDEVFPGNGRRICFIGLNPSRADAKQDDQTIRKVTHIAKREGYSELVMLNLFALVSTDPSLLLTHLNPNDGSLNDIWLKDMVGNGPVVFCWGAFSLAYRRAGEVITMFPHALCLGKTKEGHPKHPCRLANNTPLVQFIP